jgi:predicted XRE-type DNA-binding protein
MTASKKNHEEIIKIPLDPEEEKVFQWVESDECLGSWMPSKSASVSEKTKYQFSQVITRYLVKNNLSETEMAHRLDLDKNATARLLRGYVENFSLEKIVDCVKKLQLQPPSNLWIVNKSIEKTYVSTNNNTAFNWNFLEQKNE